MQRYLHEELVAHFRDHRQMVFLSGPRQVGKTTVARELGGLFPVCQYLTWDDHSHRDLILQGPGAVAQKLALDSLQADWPLCIFDELHKYRKWRDFLKGFFDQYESRTRALVTGSASLETFRRGGDSLMGRYFPYTLHPVSVAECLAERKTAKGKTDPTGELINHQPVAIDKDRWDALWHFGGFPEPFLKANRRFYSRWRALRTEQLFRDDLRDLTRIQELGQMEMLAELLRKQVGQLTSYSYLSKTVRISVDTVRRWVATLKSLYHCFSIGPWHDNVARALRKEPKYYLWDWSQVDDPGTRAENMVACALLKAVNWWTETGEGAFSLHFIRDKQRREVDFLVTRDRKPWFLVEVKSSGSAGLSGSLAYFQRQTQAPHAFQVAWDAAFVERDCFEQRSPIIVPARTFLAQLV